jgi:hypothetical protein
MQVSWLHSNNAAFASPIRQKTADLLTPKNIKKNGGF